MSTTEIKPRPRRARAECCDEACDSGRRNRYFPGKRLTPQAFRIEQDYMIERRRLLNRAVSGWGVVYGYSVKAASDPNCPQATAGRLEIGDGLALDEPGRELVQTRPLLLDVGSTTMPPADRLRDIDEKTCWLLRVHYAERPLAKLSAPDPCRCERTEWDQVCETVHYSLEPLRDCQECCQPFPCGLTCGCAKGACCGQPELGEPAPPPAPEPAPPLPPIKDVRAGDPLPARDETPMPAAAMPQALGATGAGERRHLEDVEWEKERALERQRVDQRVQRGGCECMCEHLTRLHPGADCEKLCPIDTNCGELLVDLHNGVPLACVTLRRGECGWEFSKVVDACGPRRLVKRNDLLYDLIRGCDLTYVSHFGWEQYHRAEQPVPFEDFCKLFCASLPANKTPVLTQAFWISFSGPVRTATVRPDCFRMSLYFHEPEDGWRQRHDVPVVDVTPDRPQPGDPAGTTRRVTLCIAWRWVADGLLGADTRFTCDKSWFELEMLGDYILDCNGQAVDANAIGLLGVPTGNGVPGDAFVSRFPVGPAPKDPDQDEEVT